MASTNESLKVILEKLGGEVPEQASNSELIALIAEATAEVESSGTT